MYNQIIYFIVVLLLFSLEQPRKAPASYEFVPYIVILFVFFAAYSRAVFQKLCKDAANGMPASRLSHRYYRAQTRLSIMAIGCILIDIYAFNLDAYLLAIPGFNRFATVSGLTGLAFFLFHLGAIWFWAYPVHQAIHHSRLGRLKFLRGHLSFGIVLLLPWVLISTITDLLQFARFSSFLALASAQFLMIGLGLFGFVLFGPWLMVRLWGCKPLPPGPLKEELEGYCDKHGFRTGGVLLWPLFGGEMLTAGVVGILPRLRYILITSGLLHILDIRELEAVVAHEMGHVRKKHLLVFVLLFVLFVILVYNLGDLISLMVLSNRTVLKWAVMLDDSGSTLISLASSLPLLVLTIVFFRFVFGYFLRNSERQADLFAMELLGNPHPLVSSFEKIARHSGRIEDIPSWHHYSIRERIRCLYDAFENRELIGRHNRKLYRSILAFVVLVSALSYGVLRASESGIAEKWRTRIEIAVLERELSQHPEDAEMQAAYGGLLYKEGRYSEAESVLNAALGADPQNPIILNNLAWLYATAPPPHRNPADALELAVQAATLRPAPNILDTLAEAYYVNGRYEDALAAIELALSKESSEREHFLQQKKKFEQALRSRQA